MEGNAVTSTIMVQAFIHTPARSGYQQQRTQSGWTRAGIARARAERENEGRRVVAEEERQDDDDDERQRKRRRET